MKNSLVFYAHTKLIVIRVLHLRLLILFTNKTNLYMFIYWRGNTCKPWGKLLAVAVFKD